MFSQAGETQYSSGLVGTRVASILASPSQSAVKRFISFSIFLTLSVCMLLLSSIAFSFTFCHAHFHYLKIFMKPPSVHLYFFPVLSQNLFPEFSQYILPSSVCFPHWVFQVLKKKNFNPLP